MPYNLHTVDRQTALSAWLQLQGLVAAAIAGNGDLTTYLIEEFSSTSHDLTILTRSPLPKPLPPSSSSSSSSSKIRTIKTDYSPCSLLPILSKTDVLISTISPISAAYTKIHLALLTACQDSPTCKRFVPAEFAADIESYPDQPHFYFPFHEPVREALRAQADVEWTLVCIGWLADYFIPRKNRYIRDIDGFHPVDWSGREIVIPGTGGEPVDFTWARDVARGIVALVDAPPGRWGRYTFMRGERSCWNDAIHQVRKGGGFGGVAGFGMRWVSLRDTVEMVKNAKKKGDEEDEEEEEILMLADYYFLSMSLACASPEDKVEECRERYFGNLRFRTLREGLGQLDEDPDIIL
ncbi:hypothetical protein GGS20DRAFT_574347 [Poronia punctata]|nr:hypothetical protein GGS20DRAFT_574347 [Poronia punctata]